MRCEVKVLEFSNEIRVFFVGRFTFKKVYFFQKLFRFACGFVFFFKQISDGSSFPTDRDKPFVGSKVHIFLHYLKPEMVFSLIYFGEITSLREVVTVKVKNLFLIFFRSFHNASDVFARRAVFVVEKFIRFFFNVQPVYERVHNDEIDFVYRSERILIISVYSVYKTVMIIAVAIREFFFYMIFKHYGQSAFAEIFAEDIRFYNERIDFYFFEKIVIGESERPVELCPLVHNSHFGGDFFVSFKHHALIFRKRSERSYDKVFAERFARVV